MKPYSLKWIALTTIAMIAVLLLSACSFSLPTLGGIKGVDTTTPEAAATVTEDAGEEGSPPSPTETEATAEPEETGSPDVITAAEFGDPENPPHGLVLFTSTAEQPFDHREVKTSGNPNAERYLWAISTDGKRAGQVSPAGSGSALYVPEAANKKARVVPNGIQLAVEQIEPIEMPEECAGEGNQNCGGFQFSPTGSMLAYFTGAGACVRTLTLYDLEAKKFASNWENAHWAYFFKNGSLVFALGGCDSQQVHLYYPNTGKQAMVGEVGKASWNPTHTAVVYQVQGKPELQAALWGFNLETSRVFLWPATETVIEDTPIWLGDGEYFVFQHQSYRYDRATKDAILTGPRQVILMNANTRSQRLLGFDTRSNYHLCGADELPEGQPGSPCEQPYGNWLRILRLPYQSLRFPAADPNTPSVRCGLYGLDCEEKPEVLALDWQTGKQYPWDEARVPEGTATPGAHLPDLDKQPLFQDPAGEFALYTGKGGKTLWYVPSGQEPVLWVKDGENFIFLP